MFKPVSLLSNQCRGETKTSVLVSLLLCLMACDSGSDSAQSALDPSQEKPIINRILVRHDEIRHDILQEMDKYNMAYWINDDNSIGFPPSDAETVDAIYYEVVGAYAARN